LDRWRAGPRAPGRRPGLLRSCREPARPRDYGEPASACLRQTPVCARYRPPRARARSPPARARRPWRCSELRNRPPSSKQSANLMAGSRLNRVCLSLVNPRGSADGFPFHPTADEPRCAPARGRAPPKKSLVAVVMHAGAHAEEPRAAAGAVAEPLATESGKKRGRSGGQCHVC
jgi:hypothetical protein